MISIQNLTKYYDTQKAVDNLSIEIKAGEILGILGRTVREKRLQCEFSPVI